jgi:hypothetical protein
MVYTSLMPSKKEKQALQQQYFQKVRLNNK